MTQQFKHSMLPETNHDELARQNFVQSLSNHVFRQIAPGNKVIYETVLKPKFEQQYQRSPKDRHEVKRLMQDQPYYRWYGALKRTTQEMMWESVISSVERQLPELIERAKEQGSKLGTLTLDPNFQTPRYQKAVDLHCMPGGYHNESTLDDVSVGAIYDRFAYLYGQGWLGSLNDDMGQSAIQNYLKQQHPNFQPTKILDLGCTVGHSTLPYVDAYPEAEIYAIDIGASMLRYGHARAEALGKKVHFSQQNAEKTNFPDRSFNLVVSHILLHEIPVPAIRNVMRECYRLLAPGGMMIHVEGSPFRHMDAYGAFMYDWQTANNNEPFWSAMRDLDLTAVVSQAGFAPEKIIETFIPASSWMQKSSNDNSPNSKFNIGMRWFVLAATK